MKYKLKCRSHKYCEESDHKYEITLDGYLMTKGKDGKWHTEFDFTEIPCTEEINKLFKWEAVSG